MSKIIDYLEKVDAINKHFVGTISFKNEELKLPDGRKMALGIDDGHWVLICQRPEDKHFQVFRYDHHANKIFVDQKAGGPKDLEEFKKFLEYFLSEAKVSDLVTLLPPEV